MRTAFADTSFYAALANPRDPYHSAAKRAAKEFRDETVTTEYVLIELGNGLARSGDRPLFLDATNIAKGWHAILGFPTLLGQGNSLKVSYANGDAFTPDFLGWLFTGATGPKPDEFRDADPVWTVSFSRRVSDIMTASILYGRREADNVMSPQIVPVEVVGTTPIFATDDPIQVIRAEVAVQF